MKIAKTASTPLRRTKRMAVLEIVLDRGDKWLEDFRLLELAQEPGVRHGCVIRVTRSLRRLLHTRIISGSSLPSGPVFSTTSSTQGVAS